MVLPPVHHELFLDQVVYLMHVLQLHQLAELQQQVQVIVVEPFVQKLDLLVQLIRVLHYRLVMGYVVLQIQEAQLQLVKLGPKHDQIVNLHVLVVIQEQIVRFHHHQLHILFLVHAENKMFGEDL